MREDEFAIVFFEDGEELLEHSANLAGAAQDQFALKIAIDIEPVALADAENQAGNFGEFFEELANERFEKVGGVFGILTEALTEGRGEGHDVLGEVDLEPLIGQNLEQSAKFFPIDSDFLPNFGFVIFMVRQVRQIVQGNRVVADLVDPLGEFAHIGPDLIPLLATCFSF